MRVGEHAVWSFINVEDSVIVRKAGQHDVAPGGESRNAFRDGAAISNKLLCLAAVPVISGHLEAGLQQPLRNRPANVADPDKSEPSFFRRGPKANSTHFRGSLLT